MQRVLIVGAGIGGLALVRALAGTDVRVDVVERAARLGAAGVGIVLHPNGMRALAELGLSDAVARAGNALRSLAIRRGEARLDLALERIWRGAEQPTIALPRTNLHALLAAGAFGPGSHARLRLDTMLDGVALDGDAATARFGDGSTERYDLIVGADGVHSAVRRALRDGAPAVATGLTYRRFVSANAIGLDPAVWLTVEQDERSYGFIPLGPDALHCFVQARAGDDGALRDDDAYLERTIGSWDERLAASIACRRGPLIAGPGFAAQRVDWGRERCVLLGDAAHAVSPTLSEGASLALEDAVELARALRSADGVGEALASYRANRHEPATWALRMATAQTNAARRPGRTLQTDPAIAENHLRHVYLPLLPERHHPWLKTSPAPTSRSTRSSSTASATNSSSA